MLFFFFFLPFLGAHSPTDRHRFFVSQDIAIAVKSQAICITANMILIGLART